MFLLPFTLVIVQYKMLSPLARLFLHALEHSDTISAHLPEVRRLCLMGTIRYPNPLLVDGDYFDEENIPPAIPVRDDREVLSIMMENVRSSPYISKEQFQQVVLEVLNGDQKLVPSGTSDLIAT